MYASEPPTNAGVIQVTQANMGLVTWVFLSIALKSFFMRKLSAGLSKPRTLWAYAKAESTDLIVLAWRPFSSKCTTNNAIHSKGTGIVMGLCNSTCTNKLKVCQCRLYVSNDEGASDKCSSSNSRAWSCKAGDGWALLPESASFQTAWAFPVSPEIVTTCLVKY